MFTPTRRSLACSVAWASLLLVPATGLAQKSIPVPSNTKPVAPAPADSRTPSPSRTPETKRPNTVSRLPAVGAVPLADEEFHLDSVGLRMRIPAGAQAESVRIGDRSSVQIAPADAKWIINVQTPVTSNENATVAETVDRTIEALEASVGVVEITPDRVGVADSQAVLLDRIDDLALIGGPAARFYISIPPESGSRSKSRLIKGYTIFKPLARQFVIFELICGEPDFARARSAYETCVATASFDNAEEMSQSRHLAIKSGVDFFASLSEQDYLSAMNDGKEIWYRMFMPAPNGAPADATELGYRGLKFWKGQRGQIDPKKGRADYAQADLQEGYLAQDRCRVLVNGLTADSVTIYFMSPDRMEEAWSATTSVKDPSGKSVAVVTEMGSRLTTDLTVVTSETGKPSKTIKPAIAGDGYISQFEKALLPRLLARKRASGELGFYAWDTFSGTVVFRRDAIDPASVRSRDARVWDITTTIRDESKRQVTTVSDTGELIGATLPDGRMWESIELPVLMSLWQKKGLPTGK